MGKDTMPQPRTSADMTDDEANEVRRMQQLFYERSIPQALALSWWVHAQIVGCATLGSMLGVGVIAGVLSWL